MVLKGQNLVTINDHIFRKVQTTSEIARKLYLTEGTVKNYISNIYSKLDVTGRHKAVFKAKEQGIIKP